MADDLRDLLTTTAQLALDYLDSSSTRPVAQAPSMDDMVVALGGPLQEEPATATEVVSALATAADAGLVVTNGGRYFGFVEGGIVPAALAADWLTTTWDQNPGFYALSPAAAAAEEVCRGWLCDLLGLPADASAGFTTGAQMANLTGLAAARHHVLDKAGWDVEADGLLGAPEVNVIVGEQRHATVGRALRFLGLGERRVTVVPADDQGRMQPAGLRDAISGGSTIVVAQAGNVNTGSFDPMRAICEIAHEHDGLGPRRRRLRAVGGGESHPQASRGRRRARRLVGGRRAQVAQRPVRLRCRPVRSPAGTSPGDVPDRRVSGAHRQPGRDGLDAGELTARQGVPREPHRSLLRPCAAFRQGLVRGRAVSRPQ